MFIPEQVRRRWEYYKIVGNLPPDEVELLNKALLAEATPLVQQTDVFVQENTVSVENTEISAEVQKTVVSSAEVREKNEIEEKPVEKRRRRRKKVAADGTIIDVDGDGIPDDQE